MTDDKISGLESLKSFKSHQTEQFKTKINPSSSVVTFNQTWINNYEFIIDTSDDSLNNIILEKQILLQFLGTNFNDTLPKNIQEYFALTLNKDTVRTVFKHQEEYIIGKEYIDPLELDATTQVRIDLGQKADKWILNIPIHWSD